jgi:apolipoprotein N-acyltransferase
VKRRLFLPAILTGVLLWTAFFPLDLGPIAFVALVPWLTLVRAPGSGRRVYLAGYLGGLTFYAIALKWLPVAHPMMYLSWAGLALVLPLFWVLGLFILRRIDQMKLVPLAVSVPVVWIAFEYARAHFPTGYPFLQHVGLYQMIGFGWYFLGYSQHQFLPLIQIADLGGVYAVSFIVAAVNGLAADWAMRSAAVRRWLRWEPNPPTPFPKREGGADSPPLLGEGPGEGSRPPIASTLAVAALFAAALGYGLHRLDHPEFTPGPRVAAIQGSVSQYEKNQKGESLGKVYADLHRTAAAATPRPDLIVWPETCFPLSWLSMPTVSTAPDEVRNQVAKRQAYFASQYWQTRVLLGLNAEEWEGGKAWKYNSALLLDERGQPLGRYDKMHLVIFGEYVPFKETLPWMQTFTPYENDYSCRPGERWTRFPLTTADGRDYRFACLICYEDSDPYLARQYVRDEPVNFLVNISNDGWFDGTEEHEEHLAICRFRAVETRRSIVRAVNMGISAVIDSDGRVAALPAESWSASKKAEGVVAANVPLDDRESWYARLGDWIPATCWGLLLLGHVTWVIRNRRRTA